MPTYRTLFQATLPPATIRPDIDRSVAAVQLVMPHLPPIIVTQQPTNSAAHTAVLFTGRKLQLVLLLHMLDPSQAADAFDHALSLAE